MFFSIRSSIQIFVFVIMTLACEGFASPLVIDAENGAGPWGNEMGVGCGNDIVKAAFDAAGVPIDMKFVPYSRCKQDVLRDQAVACFGMGDTENDVKNKISFAKPPLYFYRSSFITGAGKNLDVKKIENISDGATVGIVISYEYAEQISNLKQRGVKFVTVATEAQIVKMILAGHIDYGILNSDSLKTEEYIIRSAVGRKASQVRIAFKGPSLGTYVGFSQSHPEGKSALKAFEKGMRGLAKTGKLRHMMKACRKYLG